MRISDGSADVCSSDLGGSRKKRFDKAQSGNPELLFVIRRSPNPRPNWNPIFIDVKRGRASPHEDFLLAEQDAAAFLNQAMIVVQLDEDRSAEHTSELQSLMRNSYAVFCLKTTSPPL